MEIITSNFLRFAKAERTVVKRLVPFFEFGGHYSLVFHRFCPIAGLQLSTVKSKIVGTASFLSTSRRGLKEGPNKLLTIRFCSKLSSMKCSAQTRECFEGVKHSLFIFISHSQFWILGEHKSANFRFWVVCAVYGHTNHHSFPKFTVNLKPKQFLQLANSDVTSFISDNFTTIFPTAPRLWRLKKNNDFRIPISPPCFFQFVWNFRICLFYT